MMPNAECMVCGDPIRHPHSVTCSDACTTELFETSEIVTTDRLSDFYADPDTAITTTPALPQEVHEC